MAKRHSEFGVVDGAVAAHRWSRSRRPAAAFARLGIAAAMLAAVASAAPAQTTPLSRDRPMGDPAAAVAEVYGRAVIEAMAAALTASTDTTCRQTRGLDATALTQRVRDLFIQHGAMANVFQARVAAAPEYAAAFDKLAGAGAMAEWWSLLADPRLQPMVELRRPVVHGEMVRQVAEGIERFLVLRRARLKPSVVDSDALMQLEDQRDREVAAAEERFATDNPLPAVRRWLELVPVHVKAFREVVKSVEPFHLMSYRDIFPGIGDRLRELCMATAD
jgi:hypothetical protein